MTMGFRCTIGVRTACVLVLVLVCALVTAVGCGTRQQADSGAPSPSSSASSEKQSRTETVSARAAEWLNRCRTGDWDWKQFGTGPVDAPTNPVVRYGITQAARKFVEPYGAVMSMQYVDRRSFVSDEGHHRTAYRYRVNLEHGKLIYYFALDADGYVGGIRIGTNALAFSYWR